MRWNTVHEAPDAEQLLMAEAPPPIAEEDVIEEAEEALSSTADAEFGRTTDPVRMYMRDVCHVVDPPGHHALDRRPGAHHPHPGAHDRDHQQDEPHLAPDPAGDRQ